GPPSATRGPAPNSPSPPSHPGNRVHGPEAPGPCEPPSPHAGDKGSRPRSRQYGAAMGSVAGTIVTPYGEVRGTVRTEGARIAAVDAARPRQQVPDRYVVPGFVDLQVNGHEDVDCATADGADWERLDRLLLAQGVTTWCPTLVTAPLTSYGERLDRITTAAARPAAGRPCIAGA